MEEISDEQQAAMALKLMDNVKQLIIDTVVESIRNQGEVAVAMHVKTLNTIADTYAGSAMHTAVKKIITEQMAKY